MAGITEGYKCTSAVHYYATADINYGQLHDTGEAVYADSAHAVKFQGVQQVLKSSLRAEPGAAELYHKIDRMVSSLKDAQTESEKSLNALFYLSRDNGGQLDYGRLFRSPGRMMIAIRHVLSKALEAYESTGHEDNIQDDSVFRLIKEALAKPVDFDSNSEVLSRFGYYNSYLERHGKRQWRFGQVTAPRDFLEV